MRKFQDFLETQILREINFGHFEAQQTSILTISTALNIQYLVIFDISSVNFFQKTKFKAPKLLIRQFLTF